MTSWSSINKTVSKRYHQNFLLCNNYEITACIADLFNSFCEEVYVVAFFKLVCSNKLQVKWQIKLINYNINAVYNAQNASEKLQFLSWYVFSCTAVVCTVHEGKRTWRYWTWVHNGRHSVWLAGSTYRAGSSPHQIHTFCCGRLPPPGLPAWNASRATDIHRSQQTYQQSFKAVRFSCSSSSSRLGLEHTNWIKQVAERQYNMHTHKTTETLTTVSWRQSCTQMARAVTVECTQHSQHTAKLLLRILSQGCLQKYAFYCWFVM